MSDENLNRKRGSYKGQLTLFNTYLGTLKESALTQAEANQLQLRIGKMESLYGLYDDVQTQLECKTEDLDALMVDREEFQSNYFTALSRAQEILGNFNKKYDDFESCSKRSSNNHKLVKLPTISLPKYSGSYEDWLGFHDTFTSLIHSNDEMDNINKFHYLKASLEGSAALVIHSIEFSGSNYEVAWKLLCDRFNNKRLLLHNHVSALFNIEPVTKESSLHLKRVIDQVNKNLRCLESLGEPVKQWDTLLIHIISNKLDTKTFREWEEHKGSLDKDVSISLDNFITFLRNRADLVETLELSSALVAGQSSQPAKTASKHRNMLSTQTTKHCVTSPPKLCPKCSGEHGLNTCSQFLALSSVERLQLLPSFKVCFNCFRSGHYANHCKKPGCKLCKRKHNTLIHVAESRHNMESDDSSERVAAKVNTAPAAASTAPVTLSASIVTTPHPNALQQQAVLLSTALIKVYDRDNREYIARAVLDSGSTACILTQGMCRKLNLHTERVDKSVVGINNTVSPVGEMCRVLIKSLNDTYSTHLHCLVLPSITDTMPSHQIDLSRLSIPADLCLADPNFHTPSAIDFIIGADIFWDLLGSQKIKLGNGQPILCETRLGWLVSGPINSGQVSTPSRTINCNFTTVTSSSSTELLKNEVQNQLTRFLQLEEVCSKNPHYSPEERLCDKHFTQNVTGLEDERFCVRLPLKGDPSILGETNNNVKPYFLPLEHASSAPLLSTRCQKQLGLDYNDEVVREIITHDFHVNDLLTGGDGLQQVLSIESKVFFSLASACTMKLRKCRSNEPQLVNDFDVAQSKSEIVETESGKTLGLSWQPDFDYLCFPVGSCSSLGDNAKRDLLPATAQMSDPIGLLAPYYIIQIGTLLQKLWLLAHDLPCLNDITPRLVFGDLYEEIEGDFFRFYNLSRLIHAVAYYVLRFVSLCRKQVPLTGYLNNSEVNAPKISFPEYKLLLDNHAAHAATEGSLLKVFLDENKVMRVGGRLDNSSFSYEKKRNEKGQVVAPPLMENLPDSRLLPNLLLEIVCVNYAGPLISASRQGCGCRLVKVYIAIFVCFTTKAAHLELVGDLTSTNYLSALRRFISRRGLPSDVHLNYSASFVGPYNDLSKFLKGSCSSLAEAAFNENINFHLIPAYSPHSGGLWEADINFTKYYSKRVLGDCNYLPYEELNTVLVQIEAVLNSRPFLRRASSRFAAAAETTPSTTSPAAKVADSISGPEISRRMCRNFKSGPNWRTHHQVSKLDPLMLVKEHNSLPFKVEAGSCHCHPSGHRRNHQSGRQLERCWFEPTVPSAKSVRCLFQTILVEREAFNARGHVRDICRSLRSA